MRAKPQNPQTRRACLFSEQSQTQSISIMAISLIFFEHPLHSFTIRVPHTAYFFHVDWNLSQWLVCQAAMCAGSAELESKDSRSSALSLPDLHGAQRRGRPERPPELSSWSADIADQIWSDDQFNKTLNVQRELNLFDQNIFRFGNYRVVALLQNCIPIKTLAAEKHALRKDKFYDLFLFCGTKSIIKGHDGMRKKEISTTTPRTTRITMITRFAIHVRNINMLLKYASIHPTALVYNIGLARHVMPRARQKGVGSSRHGSLPNGIVPAVSWQNGLQYVIVLEISRLQYLDPAILCLPCPVTASDHRELLTELGISRLVGPVSQERARLLFKRWTRKNTRAQLHVERCTRKSSVKASKLPV